MPQHRTSYPSNVHDARSALGRRFRELRQQAGLNGRQLAELLSWPPSKVSKLENARQTPTDDDVRAWTGATGAANETQPMLAALHTLEAQHAEWQRVLRSGARPRQDDLAALDQKTRYFRVFEATVVPGLLQTPEYARERFADGIRLLKIPNDVHEAVAARTQRQTVLYRPDKRFHFVLTEAALRLRLCPPEVMLGQLDRLISLSSLPNVRLGIIEFGARYETAPWHGFWLYDEDRVIVETFSAELNLAQPQEVELYARVFASLAGAAVYGRAARAILTRVIDDLAAETPESEG